MKTFLSILTLGIIFLAGCADNDSIVAPENNQTSGPNWITLPQQNGASVETEWSVTGEINGTEGGELKIDDAYFAGPFGNVKVKAKLKFKHNSFQGTETITMVLDNVNGTVTYSPHMNFNKPAELDLEFQGIDLTGVNPDSVDFVYQNPDGYFESVDYKKITVKMEDGKIKVENGKIPHFSRYGFSR
ncbi:MAG: hypothetical protein A2V93_04195 [Ignavibacteria bacterium RBG_16_34_14]|nr:MAG: hypothetical protein A2V93_04195 [Ignavibacteria bacterium RBG_16_34_14]